MVTDCAAPYVPAGGENVGFDSRIVYLAEATALVAYPLFTAIALRVSLAVTPIGEMYRVDDVVGIVPLRV